MTLQPSSLNSLDLQPSALPHPVQDGLRLPLHPTRLVGREHEVANASELLGRSPVRLLTLTGPGGVGKTRLALEVAAELVDAFADGVAFVNLAPIHDLALVVPTVAQVLGVRGGGSEAPASTLIEHLRGRRMLLILDNFEQVVEAAPIVAGILASCPDLKVLATSRVALNIRAEHVFPVAPLALVDPVRRTAGLVPDASPAVTLFVERSRAVRPNFALTTKNASAVAEICARVDGLPLAIELAAAGIRILPPEALLARLHSRMDLFASGPRDLPARHRTMRDAIAWSYDLLDQNEQALFRRLSIFAGGFSLDAAETVASAGVEMAPGPSTFNVVASLVTQNLVIQDSVAGQARFRMLETIREFGLERLDAAGETSLVRHRATTWCVMLAEEAEQELIRGEQAKWLDRLEAEQDNMREALEWSLTCGQAETGLRLAAALWRYWSARGNLREGYSWLECALARGSDASATQRGKALHHLGNLAIDLGDYAAARNHYEQSLIIRQNNGGPSEIAEPLNGLGLLTFYRGTMPLPNDSMRRA